MNDAAEPSRDAEAVARELRARGFAHVVASTMRVLLDAYGLAGWEALAGSWDHLGVDTYMADGGRYRRRRHGTFAVSADGVISKPRQPHYQSRDYNALNGGVERWFEPIEPAVANGPALQAILRACFRLFDGLTDQATRPDSWHVEAHQFRIEARPGEAGRPTPEGMHRDGVDWVLVLMIRRENVASGETSIHDLRGVLLGSFTLTEPLDAALVDDSRVFHGVTPVVPLDPTLPAFRDVLVVTFRR